MNPEEQNILNECRKGNLKQFGSLYDKYVKKIYDFIYFKTFHKETAEDLASQTFLKAVENVQKFNPDKGTFSSWLYCIARNTVIDYYRTHKVEANIEDIFDLAEENDILGDLDRKANLEKVKSHLAGLTPEQREVLIMRVWQEMSYLEISEVLGKSEESCRVLFSRTLMKLKQEIPLAIFILLLLRV